MRISSSVTGMESERSYRAVQYSARSLRVTKTQNEKTSGAEGGKSGTLFGGMNGFFDTLLSKSPENEEKEAEAWTEAVNASPSEIMNNMISGRSYRSPEKAVHDAKSDGYVRKLSAIYIFSLLFEEFRGKLDEMMAGLKKEYEGGDDIAGFSSGTAGASAGSAFRLDMSERNYFLEKEDTSFRTKGKAVCADGREIEFNINVRMSRSFEKLTSEKIIFDPVRCLDPLVINLNDGVTSVSDQDFYFDLDGDGTDEKIKSLSGGSGFLALDKNGDGTINDGTELFGTKSGDGFADLSAYDEDGDGWIDEDDEVFDKLKVWYRDEDGEYRLLNLKAAGVGAINLSHSQTDFSINDEFNRTKALVRATGMFLYEDGRAGTVQQVDMVS